jgi:hypothetical protein
MNRHTSQDARKFSETTRLCPKSGIPQKAVDYRTAFAETQAVPPWCCLAANISSPRRARTRPVDMPT